MFRLCGLAVISSKISLCSDNRLSEDGAATKYERNGENKSDVIYNNRVPSAAGGGGKLGSSNQPRHTQGRNKRRHSTLILWKKRKRTNSSNQKLIDTSCASLCGVSSDHPRRGPSACWEDIAPDKTDCFLYTHLTQINLLDLDYPAQTIGLWIIYIYILFVVVSSFLLFICIFVCLYICIFV